VGFSLLAITFMAYALIANWSDTSKALDSLSWWTLGLALLAGVSALGPAMLAWRTLLADLGSPLTLRAGTQIMFIGNLGKYLPGGIWQVLATVELARDHAAPRKRTLTATVVAMAVTLAAALVLTSIALPLTSASTARQYWWVLALVPFVLVALHPKVLTYALNLALRLARREPLERTITLPAMARSFAWASLGWLLLDIMAWLLVNDIHRGGASDFLPAAAAYMLAWSVGFLAIFAPGGFGVRELALTAALAPLMPVPQALVVATISRLISTIADLLWAGLAYLFARTARRAAQGAPGMNEGTPDLSSVATDMRETS
jgi:uncharacterized membrane protein YbhN (UPF0104 family)